MKKDWKGTFILPAMHRNHNNVDVAGRNKNDRKQVTFSESGDDVVYIFPWSPTKYLLFGKYTENELELMNRKKRQKVDHNSNNQFDRSSKQHQNQQQQHLIPILKKNHLHQNEDKNINVQSDEEKDDPFLGSGSKPLEEIVVMEENRSFLSKKKDSAESFLPSMAIFSPSGTKDLLTNGPKDTEAAKVGRTSKNEQMLQSSFEVLGRQRLRQRSSCGSSQTVKDNDEDNKLDKSSVFSSSTADGLPLLLPSPTKLNEAVFGCIKSIDDGGCEGSDGSTKRKKMVIKMPSIINNGSLAKPLIKTPRALHKRFYSTTNYNSSNSNRSFDNIQLLREEQFDDDVFNDDATTFVEKENVLRYNKNKTELPTIKDAYRSNKHNHHHHQRYRHKLSPKHLHRTARTSQHQNNNEKESLKMQVYNNNNKQLQISSKQ